MMNITETAQGTVIAESLAAPEQVLPAAAVRDNKDTPTGGRPLADTTDPPVDKATLAVRVFDWFFKTTSLTDKLLLVILAAIGWSAHYAMTIAIPAHLTQIQVGYEKVAAESRQMVDDMEAAHREERERTQSMYDKWVDRIGNRVLPAASPGSGEAGASSVAAKPK